MFIGICGKAGAGKDTIADYLVNSQEFKKISLADPIKRLVKDVFVLDDFTVYDRVAREQPLSQWQGYSVRQLLQIIGTNLFRKHIDEDIWIKSLMLRVKSDSSHNYVVPDVRFPNELNYLSANCPEFFSIKVVRSGCDGKVGTNGHESESYDLDTDFVVENNDKFSDLYLAIHNILNKKRSVKE